MRIFKREAKYDLYEGSYIEEIIVLLCVILQLITIAWQREMDSWHQLIPATPFLWYIRKVGMGY